MLAPANMPIMAAPEFIAGFVYGMTGDNHLTEIEACATGGELMFSEIETGIADIKKGGWDNDLQAALQFGIVALQVPQALKTCKNMGDDIAAIEQWAAIFKNPSELAATVTKHYLFHKAAIQSDIAAVKADWTNALYFKSGADLADLLTLAVGPITPVSEVEGLALPPLDPLVPDFTAGLIQGFTGNDHRAELEGCMTNLDAIAAAALKGLEDIKSLHFIKFAEDVGELIWLLPDSVATCGQLTQLEDDLQVMLNWAEILKHPMKVSKIASKNWLFHGTEVKADIATEEADWAAGDFYGAGQSTAAAMLTLVPLDSVNIEAPLLEYLLN